LVEGSWLSQSSAARSSENLLAWHLWLGLLRTGARSRARPARGDGKGRFGRRGRVPALWPARRPDAGEPQPRSQLLGGGRAAPAPSNLTLRRRDPLPGGAHRPRGARFAAVPAPRAPGAPGAAREPLLALGSLDGDGSDRLPPLKDRDSIVANGALLGQRCSPQLGLRHRLTDTALRTYGNRKGLAESEIRARRANRGLESGEESRYACPATPAREVELWNTCSASGSVAEPCAIETIAWCQ
jgi:hypothetical protein